MKIRTMLSFATEKCNMLVSICLVLLIPMVASLDNGLARTPPMGWLSWLRFQCTTDCDTYPEDCISEQLFRRIADNMSSNGYLDAGYKYLIIDDCWLDAERDEDGRLQPDSKRFPEGMKNLSDYIHSKGLKFGLYEDIGTHTCAKYPGMEDHFEIDTQTFADWGVDYTKIDGCYANTSQFPQTYPKLGSYFNKTGRSIVYSCSWPAYKQQNNYTQIAKACNLWRNTFDIGNSFRSVASIIFWFKKHQDEIASIAGPGRWNDPDMLIIGNEDGLNVEQSQTQMAIWAILAAPLIMSVDLNTIRREYKEILLNKAAIAINQDELAIQGKFVKTIDEVDVWVRPVAPVCFKAKSYAIAFYNTNEKTDKKIKVRLSDVGVVEDLRYSVENIFATNDLNCRQVRVNQVMEINVSPTGVAFMKFTPVSK